MPGRGHYPCFVALPMLCPSCQSPNDEGQEVCFNCRAVLVAVTAGSVIGGRYEILSRLGRGGMGTVYKAHDRELDETVAIKVLRSDLDEIPGIAKRFRSEIKLARRVGHRNVCRIFEYGQDGAIRFIAMELVEGTDLRHMLRAQGSLPWPQAFAVSIQIAEGLQAIHDLGIVHRDLKPPNIMVDPRGVVRLMDFGIAKRFEAETTPGATGTGQLVGTPEYMSPEQARAQSVDARSDVYSLGIVIFEIFTGGVPFKGDTPVATLMMHLHDPPPLGGGASEGIPSALVPAIKRALAKAPSDRQSSAAEVARDLAAAAAAISRKKAATAPSARVPPHPSNTPTEPIPGAKPTLAASQRHRGAKVPQAAAALFAAFAVAVLLVARSSQWAPVVAPSVRTAATQESSQESPYVASQPAAKPSEPTPQVVTPTATATGPLAAPRDLSVSEKSDLFELHWMAVGGAARYRVLVGVDAELRRRVMDRSVQETSLTLAGLDAGRYYWRVTALDTNGREGESSPPMTFRLHPTISAAAAVARSRVKSPEREAPLTIASPSVPVAPVPSPSAVAVEAPKSAPVPSSVSDRSPAPASVTPVEARSALQIVVVPFAEAVIDGNGLGRISSTKVVLSAGSHVVVLSHPDYLPLRRQISLVPGETFNLVVDFSEEGIRRRK